MGSPDKAVNYYTEPTKTGINPWKELIELFNKPAHLKPTVVFMREEDFEELKNFNLSETHESAHGKETL